MKSGQAYIDREGDGNFQWLVRYTCPESGEVGKASVCVVKEGETDPIWKREFDWPYLSQDDSFSAGVGEFNDIVAAIGSGDNYCNFLLDGNNGKTKMYTEGSQKMGFTYPAMPLLSEWLQIDEKWIDNLPAYLERESLSYSEYEYSSPRNSVAFLWSGGDGIHWNLLDIGNGFSAESPIVYTAPSGGLETQIVARNMHNFLVNYCEYGMYWCGRESLKEMEDWVPDSVSPEEKVALNRLKESLGLPDAPSLAEIHNQIEKLNSELAKKLKPPRYTA